MTLGPAHVDHSRLAVAPELRPGAEDRSGLGALAREVLHRLVSLLILVTLSPVVIVLAVLVRLTSPGPALFRQRRVGRDGRPFRMLKFRTMRADAEEHEEALRSTHAAGAFFKVRGDRRLTPIGAFLRRTSLDELPQLLNVVRGDMRLVGPRPLLLHEHERLPLDVQEWRTTIKPGITGLWQISGRSRTTNASRLRLDRLHVKRDSLALDLRILARTPRAVLRCEGAY